MRFRGREFHYVGGMSARDMLRGLRQSGERTPMLSMIKSESEILGCIEAGRVNSLVLDAVEREIEVGMSTADIDAIVVRETRALGGRAACLGFSGFPRSVCTSINDCICHGIPSADEIIRDSDILNVDCTTEYGGYFGDASRMFTFGNVSPTAERLVSTVKRAVDAVVLELGPFSSHLGDIGAIVKEIADAEGFSVVREIGGHGVGRAMHEDPYVCHVGVRGEGMVLVPGMIFTVEPMINVGSDKFIIDKRDGWTVRTADGSLSAQVEYELLITEGGVEIISR